MDPVEHKLARFGITESEIHVEDFEIFRHEGVIGAIERLIREAPSEEIPVSVITVVRYAWRETFKTDFEDTRRLLEENADSMERFAVQYGIDINIHLYVEQLEAGIVSEIASYAGTRSVDRLALFLQLDALNAGSADSLRIALEVLSEDPVIRNNPKVRIGNFPFCLAPPGRFKLMYRDAVEPVLGQSVAQRSLVRDIEGKDFCYHKACSHCRCRRACYNYTEVEDYPACEEALIPRQESAVVFAGGSITREEAPVDDDLVWSGPAEQGDMLAAVLEGFSTILVIDGYFYSRFPCTTFEVMLALENGRDVFGAASIGALRAVELNRYGMEGVGTVFEYLKRHEVKPYHIVAQTYDDNDRPVTIPLVHIICFLNHVTKAGLIPVDTAKLCLDSAGSLHFAGLSVDNVFRAMGTAEGVPDGTVEKLRAYLSNHPEAFDVKKQDALLLLSQFRQRLRSRPPRFMSALIREERRKQCASVQEIFKRDYDLTLPEGWGTCQEDQPVSLGDTPSSRDTRECTAELTCERAQSLLEGLDILLADTSHYDLAANHVLSVFFIPLYFYNYSPSSATGNGDVFDESLASAYMELVERIPAAAAEFSGLPLSKVNGTVIQNSALPQFYNWGVTIEEKQAAIDLHGYVLVTDILSQEPVFAPKSAVMFEFSGTDGNASGNSHREAVLYGIYELVERDTCQMHLLDDELRKGLAAFKVDPSLVTDPRSVKLMEQADEKGCSMVLFELPNLYGLPCVMCHVYDRNREIQCHGGIAVRADFQSAVRAVLQEAYMQYITYFVGTRDDYRAFAPLKRARVAYDYAREIYLKAPGKTDVFSASQSFQGVGEELDYVIKALTSSDISQILVANIGPNEDSMLSSLKVIIPGLDLWFCPDYEPSPQLPERTRTLKKQL